MLIKFKNFILFLLYYIWLFIIPLVRNKLVFVGYFIYIFFVFIVDEVKLFEKDVEYHNFAALSLGLFLVAEYFLIQNKSENDVSNFEWGLNDAKSKTPKLDKFISYKISKYDDIKLLIRYQNFNIKVEEFYILIGIVISTLILGFYEFF